MDIKYKKLGNGKVKVLFLHELMGDHRNYDFILPFLNLDKFTYIFIDLRGYGLSKDIKGEYSCDEASNDVINVIEKLNFKEVNLLAHSMSTMIAQKVAIKSKKIKKLILVTPISAAGIRMNELAKNKLLEDMKKDILIKQIVEDSSKRYNNTWKTYRINMAYNSSTLEARLGYMNMYLTTDFKKEAEENITIPIEIIVGKNDFPVFAFNQVNKNFEHYKNVNITQCEISGHYPMIESPVFFATFLENVCISRV